MPKTIISPFDYNFLQWRASVNRLRACTLNRTACRHGKFAALLAGSSLLAAGSLQAKNDAWSTNPADNTFAGINWTLNTTTPAAANGTIASGDSLYFGTSSLTTLNDNEANGFSLAGFTFNSDAAAYTIGGNSITLTGNITNSSSNLQTINDALTVTGGIGFTTTTGNLTLGGNITESGAGTFSLAAGGGTVTLGGTNSFTSGSNIFQVVGGSTLAITGTTTITLGNGQYFAVGQGGAGAGTVTVAAGGTFITAGSGNFFNGTFSGGPGTLNVNGTANFGANAPLRLGYNSQSTVNLNAGGLLVTASALTVASTTTGSTATFNFNGGTLRANAGVTLLSPNAGATTTVTTSSTASTIDANSFASTVSTPIVNGATAGGLTIIDSSAAKGGSITLSANSTYTGATTINSGTLTLTGGGNAGGALSGTPTITVNSGGKLVLTNGDTLGYTSGKEALVINSGGQVLNNSTASRDTLQNTLTMTGGILGGSSAGDANGLYSFNVSSGNTVLATSDASGTAALINASKVGLQSGNEVFNVTRGASSPVADLIISSQIVGFNAGIGFTKSGTGILVLTGANTYSGGTTVSAGTLAGTTTSLQGNITDNAALVFDQTLPATAITSGTYAGVISGTGTVAKNNAGTVNFTGANTYSGGTTVNGGTLAGTTTSLQGNITDNAALVFDQTLPATAITSGTYAGVISGTGTVAKNNAGTVNFTGFSTFTGGTTVNAGTLALGQGNFNGAGVLQGTVTVNAGAILTLNGNNSLGFTPGMAVTQLNVNGGTVDTTTTTAGTNEGYLASLNLTGGTVSDSGGTVGVYQFNVAGATPPVTITSNASATTSLISGGVVIRNTGILPFTVASGTTASGSDLTVSGAITQGGGVGGISKAGTGTLTLTGTNTYTGTTTVNAGSLVVGGSTASGSAVTVGNTATIAGAGDGASTGIIAGPVTVNSGGTIMAGSKVLANPTGILTTGALTLSTGSTFNALLTSSTVFSSLNAVGTTAVGNAAFSISLTPGATFTDGSVLELVVSSPISGVFTNSVFTIGGYSFTADYTTDPSFFDLDVAVIPEPATWAAGGLMIGLAGMSRRRKLTEWLRLVRG